MKTNRRIKESFYKMVSLNIPQKKRKEYIEKVYNCSGRLVFFPYILNSELDELVKKGITSDEAVLKIEEIFIDRRSNQVNNIYAGFSAF